MREVCRLNELPSAETRCVIINCSTKWVSSLALLSALRHARCPVLVIDCESTDGSRRHFEALADATGVDFDWLEWPLRPHPAALDRLFDEIVADEVLLCDSDLEIRSGTVVSAMHSALAASSTAYGAGFRHGPEWLGDAHGTISRTGYYAPRMWIPLVLLRTQVIREARQRGFSFKAARLSSDRAPFPLPARWVGLRHSVRGLRGTTGRRKPIPGLPPHLLLPDDPYPRFVEFDTGALLHGELEALGHPLARISEDLWGEVSHYHGVTRATLSAGPRKLLQMAGLISHNESSQQSVLATVMERLRSEYGYGPGDSNGAAG